MDEKTKKNDLMWKEAELEEILEEVDQGGIELTSMLTSIDTIDNDFLRVGSVEINNNQNEENQKGMHEYINDPNFIAAPGFNHSSWLLERFVGNNPILSSYELEADKASTYHAEILQIKLT